MNKDEFVAAYRFECVKAAAEVSQTSSERAEIAYDAIALKLLEGLGEAGEGLYQLFYRISGESAVGQNDEE